MLKKIFLRLHLNLRLVLISFCTLGKKIEYLKYAKVIRLGWPFLFIRRLNLG
jgi:hypothetical protein